MAFPRQPFQQSRAAHSQRAEDRWARADSPASNPPRRILGWYRLLARTADPVQLPESFAFKPADRARSFRDGRRHRGPLGAVQRSYACAPGTRSSLHYRWTPEGLADSARRCGPVAGLHNRNGGSAIPVASTDRVDGKRRLIACNDRMFWPEDTSGSQLIWLSFAAPAVEVGPPTGLAITSWSLTPAAPPRGGPMRGCLAC